MLTLSLELSSAHNDLAVLADGRVAARRTWNAREFHHTRLFALLPELFRDAGVAPAAVEFFAVGRGPGSFSGLRVALSAAQALALPGGRPVFAVSSGAALAWQALTESAAPRVAVLGDARRGTLWFALFELADGLPRAAADWVAVPLAELAARLPAGTPIISPDAQRLAPLWSAAPPPHLTLPAADAYPTAESVARLALARRARGESSEPLVPIYLHPAVAAPKPENRG